jgi:hypothetical protein
MLNFSDINTGKSKIRMPGVDASVHQGRLCSSRVVIHNALSPRQPQVWIRGRFAGYALPSYFFVIFISC